MTGQCHLAVCSGRREHGVWWEPPDSSESGEHLQFCTSVFASFPRAIIWVGECSSQGTFLKLSRVPRLSLNNRTRGGVPPSQANLLVSYYLCSAFLCIEPSPIWNWILRLWFPTFTSPLVWYLQSFDSVSDHHLCWALLSLCTVLWWTVYVSFCVWTQSISCFLTWHWVVRMASLKDSVSSYLGLITSWRRRESFSPPWFLESDWWTTYSSVHAAPCPVSFGTLSLCKEADGCMWYSLTCHLERITDGHLAPSPSHRISKCRIWWKHSVWS